MKRVFAAAIFFWAGLLGQQALADPTCSEAYVVAPGDSLAKIARGAYQDRRLWRYIYDYRANAKAIGNRPGRLSVGTRLELPPCPRVVGARPTSPKDDPPAPEAMAIEGSATSDASPMIEPPKASASDPAVTITPRLASTATKAGPSETGGPLIKVPPAERTIEPAQDIAMATPSILNDGRAHVPFALELSVTAEQANEADGVMYFRLQLSEPPEHSIVIIYTVLDGSAIDAADFKHREGVVVFEPGQQQVALAVQLIDDEAAEDVETFKLFISGDPASVTIASRTIEASIQDNDS